jgi:hypothetical protein
MSDEAADAKHEIATTGTQEYPQRRINGLRGGPISSRYRKYIDEQQHTGG